MRTSQRWCALIALGVIGLTSACAGASLDTSAGPTPTVQSAAPSALSKPPPTPKPPTAAEDKAKLKKAIVTAKELGKPWLQPPKVNSAGGKVGELCPGQKNLGSLVKTTASVGALLTEGSQPGAAIGSFGVWTLPPERMDALAAAHAATIKGCGSWKQKDATFVVLSKVTTPEVAGADETFAHIERIYLDSSKQRLLYVRQVLFARSGRVMNVLEYAFVMAKSDPTGKNFTKTTALLEKQLAKSSVVFTH